MSDVTLVPAATLDRFVDVVGGTPGVDLRQLPPFTTLLFRTMNSLYRMVIIQGSEVYVQGGDFFPELTSAVVNGASIGGCCLKRGWIGIGLRVEIRSEGRHIITSTVSGITAEQGAPGGPHAG
ncbi:MAG TPA: hypothetical protein VK886_02265 [Vicinamibacterales bacterium]|nr:hypothetical protein [Vicinamibacterales bacterium]